jgi:crossover junction endodeoxyribonuclease RuvC
VVMEKVGPMPKQGVTSMFTFGAGYGALQMAAVSNGCRLFLVTPQEWKKVILAGTDKSKDSSIRVCECLFPSVVLVPPGCRKPHDGMAEAILLAEYGRRQNL